MSASVGGDEAVAVDLADVVQEKIHQAQAPGAGDDFVAVKGFVFQETLLCAA